MKMRPGLNTGDSAWMLVSFAMVLLMTPGLAFFYGGMARAKNLVSILYMSFVSIGGVTLIWFLYGYGVIFGKDVGGLGLIGWGSFPIVQSNPAELYDSIPTYVFSAFQLSFAIITVALISGSIAGRTRLGPWMVFGVVWVTLVYLPIAHWVFAPGGWIHKMGALDFAGGLVVELNSGMAGLAMALALGPGLNFRHEEPPRPRNVPYVLLGLGLLWFGWFGFNGGSAVTDGAAAANAVINTMVAGSAGMIAWMLLERVRTNRFSTLGMPTGAVAGLVAITPSCAYVNLVGAFVIGVAAAVICSYAVEWKAVLGFDDTLDVVGVHGAGGIVGMLLIGLFATGKVSSATQGLFYGGSLSLLGKQAVAILAVAAYSLVVTYVIGKIINRLLRMRTTEEEERTGLDAMFRTE
jgi:ammonium transporter, Amt family